MKRLKFLKTQLNNASKEAKKAAGMGGMEICGLLLDNGYFIELVRVANKTKRGGGFSFYFNEIRAIERMARAINHEIIGTFHSHPVGLAEPGRSDLHYSLDDEVMMIFDVIGKKIGLWQIKDRRARRLKFNLIHSHPIGGKENGLEKPVCPVTRQG